MPVLEIHPCPLPGSKPWAQLKDFWGTKLSKMHIPSPRRHRSVWGHRWILRYHDDHQTVMDPRNKSGVARVAIEGNCIAQKHFLFCPWRYVRSWIGIQATSGAMTLMPGYWWRSKHTLVNSKSTMLADGLQRWINPDVARTLISTSCSRVHLDNHENPSSCFSQSSLKSLICCSIDSAEFMNLRVSNWSRHLKVLCFVFVFERKPALIESPSWFLRADASASFLSYRSQISLTLWFLWQQESYLLYSSHAINVLIIVADVYKQLNDCQLNGIRCLVGDDLTKQPHSCL